MSIVTVSFKLEELSVQVKPKKGMSKEEVVELAKKELVKKMKEEFPTKVAIRITDGVAISLEDCNPGQLVKYKETGGYAVITAIKVNTKFPIHFTTDTGKVLKGVPGLFELIDDEKVLDKILEKNQFKKRLDYMWTDGDVGYFLNGGKVFPVVVGGTTRGKTRVYDMGIKTEGRYYSLDEQAMKRIFVTKEEAESRI